MVHGGTGLFLARSLANLFGGVQSVPFLPARRQVGVGSGCHPCPHCVELFL